MRYVALYNIVDTLLLRSQHSYQKQQFLGGDERHYGILCISTGTVKVGVPGNFHGEVS